MVSCLGSLVQSCCGEGGALQTDVAGLCGERSQCSGHAGFAPLRGVCFPVCTAQAPGCSMGAGPEWRAIPVFGSPQKRRLGWACVLCLPHPSSSGNQELDWRTLPGCSAPSPLRGPSLFPHTPVGCVRLVSVLGSWPLATTLPADVDHPESQEVFG